MANSSLLSEQLKRPDKTPIGWPWQLFTFGMIALSLSLFVFLGMKFGYLPYLNAQIKNREAELKTLEKSITEEQKQTLISFYSQLINSDTLLKSHKFGSKFFDALEKNTHERVYFADLTLMGEEKIAKLNGIAPSFEIVSEQLDLFKKTSGVDKVSLESAQVRDKEGIYFSITLNLNDLIFQQQTNGD